MSAQRTLPDEEILNRLCKKYDVKPELIVELLLIERGYQDYERRKGIFHQISDLIKNDLDERNV